MVMERRYRNALSMSAKLGRACSLVSLRPTLPTTWSEFYYTVFTTEARSHATRGERGADLSNFFDEIALQNRRC